jgi:hypothetical protein
VKKIAIVIPYFGEWPSWIDAYFFSCEQNPLIEVILYTDCRPINGNIPNVKIHRISFELYCEKISQSLGIDFKPKHPYKLCDVKPFYGYIHQEELKEYEFFGFGDIDLIYGNIEKFITPDILRDYDFISTHGDRVAGHFFLMRNTGELRQLAFQINDWKIMLKDEKIWILDEARFTDVIIPKFRRLLKKVQKTCDILEKISFLNRRWLFRCYHFLFVAGVQYFLGFRKKRLYFREMYTTPRSGRGYSMKYLYNQGRVIDLDTERDLIYLHFFPFIKGDFKKDLWNKATFCTPPAAAEEIKNNKMLIDNTGFHILGSGDACDCGK